MEPSGSINLPLIINGFRLYISGDWVEEELIHHEVKHGRKVFFAWSLSDLLSDIQSPTNAIEAHLAYPRGISGKPSSSTSIPSLELGLAVGLTSKISSILLPAFVFLVSLGPPLLPSVQVASFQDVYGLTFFDNWNFFGNYDNLTTWLEASSLHFKTRLQCLNPHIGAVVWPDKADTLAQGLVFVNSAGNAVIKVDNTTTMLYPNKIRFGKFTPTPVFVVLTNQ